MTENPTIPSPPGPSQPPSLANSATTPEDAADSSGEIDCICEVSDDDGFTICCDKCDTWQHLVCVQLNKDNVPHKYFCPRCLPRILDVQKAKDIQRQRREEEQAKRSHKKKRPAGTSHRKKELTNGTNGITSGKVSSSTDRTGAQGSGKSISPKETQQPSRKRGHRLLAQPNSSAGVIPYVHYNTVLNNVPNTNPPSEPLHALSVRNGETESDTDPEKPTRYLGSGFTDLGNSPNKCTSVEVEQYLRSLAVPAPNSDTPIYYHRQDLASLGLPKASPQFLSESSKPKLEYSRGRLLLAADCAQGDLISICKGEVGFKDSYKEDRANHYLSWDHPKPYVFFHPNLPVYVDARRYGTEARFVRRSCRPNLVLKTIVIDRSEICFGFFAEQALGPDTELTLSWDWSGTASHRFVQEGYDIHRLSSEHLKEFAVWTQQLTHRMGDCACSTGKECLFNRIKRMVDTEMPVGKTPNGNGGLRKQRKTNSSTESSAAVGLKRPSPERQPVMLKKEEDEESRSVSPPLSRGKPRSRDLTPSTLLDTAVERDEMSGRDARKFKDVLSRIEKQQQEEQQPQGAKRRKRNSTASLTAGTLSLHSPGIESKDGMKGTDTKSGLNHGFGEYSVTDAGVGRRASDSPISSDERKYRRTASFSPVGPSGQGFDTPRHASKVVTKPVRPQYEDKAIQTDPVEEIPWWSPTAVKTPPRAPRLPLRKRLMQSLLRDREEAAAMALEDKKRKHGTDSGDPEISPSPKAQKLSSGVPVRSRSSPSLDAKRSPDAPSLTSLSPAMETSSVPTQALITPDTAVDMVDASVIKPPTSPSPSGPVPVEPPSADLDKPSSSIQFSNPTQGKQPPEQAHGRVPQDRPQDKPQDKPQVNGSRKASLHVQLPLGLGAVNGPPTASLQSSVPSSASVQSPPTISPNYVNLPALNSTVAHPSPTRTTKKMSLTDYNKRKHKADPVEKSDEKSGAKAANEGPTTLTSLSKPPVVPIVGEPRGIADSTPSALPVAAPSGVNSTKISIDQVRISTAPKEQQQRTTSLSSSVR